MEFFCVFCVVLFVHTGVTLPYRNNAQVIFSEIPTSAKDTTSTKDITLGQQGLLSKWDEKGSLSVQHPIGTNLTHTGILPNNSKNGQSKGFISNQPNNDNQILTQTALLPRGNIFSSNTENLNSSRRVDYDLQNQPNIKQSFISEADTRLDLQGISLENIKSFIDQPSIGSPTEPELPTSTDLILNKDNSIQYILNKAKQVHSIYESDKKLKRYTIIHPDGTVEHTDDLEKLSVTYPNYVKVKYSDLTKYNTNVSEIMSEARPTKISQEENGETMPKTPNNLDIELRPHDTGSPIILRKETLAPEVMNNDKNKEEQSLYSKKNAPTNIVNVTNLDKTMQYESIVPHTTSHSDTTSKTDFDITTPTSVTVPQKNTVKTKNATLENFTPDPSHTRTFSEGNNSNSQDNTNISNTPSSQQSSPSSSLDDVDYSGIWYQDKDFWAELKNNTQYNLLFFMYVPTAPQVRKETKTTIYPNGTTVEEVTEIVDGKDGFPVATKTTKVTLAEDIDLNEKKV